MTTTSEDVAVLASLRLDDGRLLVARDLVEQATLQIALWREVAGGLEPESPMLELAADVREIEALRELCAQAAGAAWDRAPEGGQIAATPPLGDGARLVALRDGEAVAIVRQPDPQNRIRLPRSALAPFGATLLAAIAARLEALGLASPAQPAAG
jgi:hypothetical protein